MQMLVSTFVQHRQRIPALNKAYVTTLVSVAAPHLYPEKIWKHDPSAPQSSKTILRAPRSTSAAVRLIVTYLSVTTWRSCRESRKQRAA